MLRVLVSSSHCFALQVGKRDHVVFSMNAKAFNACCSSFKGLMVHPQEPLPQLLELPEQTSHSTHSTHRNELELTAESVQMELTLQVSQPSQVSPVQNLGLAPSHFVHGEEDLDSGRQKQQGLSLPQQDHFFFQVIGGNLNRHKFVGRKPLDFDATVQLYDAKGCREDSMEVDLQPTGIPLAAKFQSVADELASLCVWKLEKEDVTMTVASMPCLLLLDLLAGQLFCFGSGKQTQTSNE